MISYFIIITVFGIILFMAMKVVYDSGYEKGIEDEKEKQQQQNFLNDNP